MLKPDIITKLGEIVGKDGLLTTKEDLTSYSYDGTAVWTHMPEAVVYADKMNADIETYIQIYNAGGFLMQVEADWVMRVIHEAKKPVMTIKPLAAGRLLPVVGLAFVWNTIRDQDMVTIGTTTPDEAREVIEISLDLLNRRIPSNELQETRSKKSLVKD